MASQLLSKDHVDTDIHDIMLKLEQDDMAFYDERTYKRKIPVFVYDQNGEPLRISHWNTRLCAPPGMTRPEAELKGLDYYKEGRGWIRAGKKAEKDFS